MKKLLLLGMSAFVLGACGNSGNNGNNESSSSSAAEASIQSSNSQSDPNDIGNGILEEVGQYSTKNGATITLEAIAKTGESYEIAEGITVENIIIKIMTVDNIEDDYADGYEYMEIYNGDYMIQVTYDMKNETEYTLQSISTPTLITSEGEQISSSNTIGDYELLSGGTTYTSGASSKINNPEIEGLTINWDMFQEDENFTDIDTNTIEIKF